MSILKIDLTSARFQVFKNMLVVLEVALKEFGIDFYVIGAVANDIIFSVGGIPIRGTKDVDFAVYINDHDQYQLIRNYLIKNYQFSESNENAFSLISRDGHILDILPFGNIEVEDGVAIEGQGLMNIKVNGLKEIYESGLEEVETEQGNSFKTASLASIILLKLIAFDDRPENRGNDPGDVAYMINNYFNLNDSKIFEYHNDLFGGDESLEIISSTVIGREIKLTLVKNAALFKRTISIIDNHIRQEENSQFVKSMIGDYCDTINMAIDWFKSIKNGISDTN